MLRSTVERGGQASETQWKRQEERARMKWEGLCGNENPVAGWLTKRQEGQNHRDGKRKTQEAEERRQRRDHGAERHWREEIIMQRERWGRERAPGRRGRALGSL